jgi:hypothetical protein
VMGSARASSRLFRRMDARNSAPAGMGRSTGARLRFRPLLGSPGTMGSGDVMREQMPGPGSTSVMPPSFGYPFYQPPSLLGPSSGGAGMSM